MRRVLIAGAGGAFGALIASRLRDRDIATEPLAADVESSFALARVLSEGDVVVDAAGPFQRRSTALLEAAIDVRCDVVDINDALTYAQRVVALAARAALAGVRVVSSCSAVAAVAAACVRSTGIARPDRVDIFLAPAARVTAGGATARSFLSSVGSPIRVWRDGAMRDAVGWRIARSFPLGRRRGREVESAAAVLMPRAWPSLRDVGFWVDPNVPLSNAALAVIAHFRGAAIAAPLLFPLARLLGSSHGVFAVQVEGEGRLASVVLEGRGRSHVIAAEPAVLAVESIVSGAGPPPGVVPADQQVDPTQLFERLRELDVERRVVGP